MNAPHLIAHRGYALHYPENTLLALSKAVQAGARFVEFDIQLTADGVPVLLHDATLQRMAGSDLCIHDITLTEARAPALTEPGRFGTAFSDVRIATLSETVDWLRTEPATTAFVEIKRASLRRFGIETVLDAVLPVLAPASNQCVVISFDDMAVRYARARSAMKIGWVFEPWSDDALAEARQLKPDYLFTDADTLPPEVTTLPAGPWQWAIYEVTDPELALRLAARGAALVETFAIGEMLRDARMRAGKNG